MGRLAKRALMLFAAYVGVILAVIAAGFFGAAVGIWASLLWGLLVVAVIAALVRRGAFAGL